MISLGKTSVSDGIGLDAPFAEYGDSGYKIQTSDEGISILGGSDTATLYGVYKFLGYHIGFKAYSTDHVTYKRQPPCRCGISMTFRSNPICP